jgi:hypothetical protein
MIYNHQSIMHTLQLGIGVAVALFGLVFALGDFLPSGRYYTLVLYLCILNNAMLSAASNHQCFPSSSSFNSSFIFVYSSNSHVLVPTKTLLWSMINCQTRIKLLFRYLFFPCLLISSFASSESTVQDIYLSLL